MYLVYLLCNGNKTYVGMTNDFLKRWRQHIGDLKGGAKYTTRNGKDWYPILIIDGFETKREACQCEWRLKHNKKYRGPLRRVQYAYLLFQNERWTSKSPLIQDQKLKIYIDDNYRHLFETMEIQQLYWR
tara:strand:- start:149 stop:535 length:387 start_codon:yes stop_codon:yes gene_type:complete